MPEKLPEPVPVELAEKVADVRVEHPVHLLIDPGRQRIQRLVRAAPGPEPVGEGRQRPAGLLTGRERQIAALVGEGMSNRYIAQQLGISKRTVDAHLEHIFGKLGISSRVQLATGLNPTVPSPERPPPPPGPPGP